MHHAWHPKFLEQIRLDWNREAIRKPVNLLDKTKLKRVQ
jgi:hypothetical protein